MDQKEMMVILVILALVVNKDIVIIALGLMGLLVKWETKEKRYIHNLHKGIHYYNSTNRVT